MLTEGIRSLDGLNRRWHGFVLKQVGWTQRAGSAQRQRTSQHMIELAHGTGPVVRVERLLRFQR